jgi:SWI/SNF-related matrix-associated actin-dependent regulator 1 of chromatin subfamily A
MTDIQIINNETVRFQKMLYHESEYLLARCFNFNINYETGVIEADIKVTSKRALYEFIRLSFKNFSESHLENERRDKFYAELSEIYKSLAFHVEQLIAKTLPYADKLYAHQKDTLIESYYKQYNFYALEMGTGKTLISASLSRIRQSRRTVIICPAAVKWNWYHDLVKFGFNELYFTIMDSRKTRNIKAFNERFVIINYDILSGFQKELLSGSIDHFILDEAHMIKNHNSLRFKQVFKLIEANPDAPVTLLSGSPVKNRVNDIFAYFKLIGHELGKSYKRFLDEYTISTTGSRGTQIKGGRNLQDLYIKLSNLMIRKTKEECLDLPEKIYLSYRYELSDYRAEYDKVIEELSQQKTISSLTGNLHSLNIITSKAKLKGIIEIAESIIEEGRKVVIFGSYTSPIEDLEKHFGKACAKVTGSVDSFQRDQNVQKFTNDPECKVFLGNMIAAGVGINLTVASDVIFINMPFTPSELYQSMDRLHRIGQKSSVNVHYTFCDESIDEYIYEIIMDKEKDIVALIDKGKEVVLRDNMVEILISKLLKKDDIVFENGGHKAKVLDPEVEAPEEATLPGQVHGSGQSHDPFGEPILSTKGNGQSAKSDLLGPAELKKYYLMVHDASDTLFISNEEALKTNLEQGCEIRFEHEDPIEVVKKGRHYQLTFAGHVNLDYTLRGGKYETLEMPDFD